MGADWPSEETPKVLKDILFSGEMDNICPFLFSNNRLAEHSYFTLLTL